MTDVGIRRVAAGDWPLLRHLRLRALATDPASFGSTREREAASADDVWQERAAHGAFGDVSSTLLALRGREPVGAVAAHRDETERHVFRVVSMWVAPEVRGQGVGRRLLDEIEDWIGSVGGSVVRLCVTDASTAARRLYETAGYEPDGHSAMSRHTPDLTEIGLRKQLAG